MLELNRWIIMGTSIQNILSVVNAQFQSKKRIIYVEIENVVGAANHSLLEVYA